MRTDMNLTGKIAVQNFKRSLGAMLALLTVTSSAVHAAQTVEPRFTVGGTAITGTQSVPAGSTFSFFGVYSDDSTGAESGLGLKVKYNGLHLTNVNITEQYTKCRIAAAQFPAGNTPPTSPTATDQVVMGWIDTAIRPNGVVGTATGAVGWPDLADLGTGGCLNPGGINTDTAAAAPTGLKLFKFTATMAPSCTSAGVCTSTVEFNSDGNFSYASATPGMAPTTFSIVGAAAPTCNLDVDGDGSVLAAKDGTLIQRALNPNITDANVIAGITITGPRNTGALIRSYLASFVTGGVGVTANLGSTVLDIDSNSTTTAASDGNAIKRALNVNITATNVITGLTLAAGTTGQSIRQTLNTRCGLSLPTN